MDIYFQNLQVFMNRFQFIIVLEGISDFNLALNQLDNSNRLFDSVGLNPGGLI